MREGSTRGRGGGFMDGGNIGDQITPRGRGWEARGISDGGSGGRQDEKKRNRRHRRCYSPEDHPLQPRTLEGVVVKGVAAQLATVPGPSGDGEQPPMAARKRAPPSPSAATPRVAAVASVASPPRHLERCLAPVAVVAAEPSGRGHAVRALIVAATGSGARARGREEGETGWGHVWSRGHVRLRETGRGTVTGDKKTRMEGGDVGFDREKNQWDSFDRGAWVQTNDSRFKSRDIILLQ